ncbi:GbsR/MarR family transcriptional regulator [Paractinoplanes durhamensis]|nr:MarR family transcriptional regulator [Actinoplanes durhamensis]
MPDEAVRQFIERFSFTLAASGMARMPARVFAALLVTDSARLTAAEAAELLQASPAAISGAVRYLAQLNLITRERQPGSRRDHYRLFDDVWYEATMGRDRMVAHWESSAREVVQSLGPDTPAGARVAEMLTFFEFVHAEMPMLIKRWRDRKAELRLDS